jgi:hypothetical protein
MAIAKEYEYRNFKKCARLGDGQHNLNAKQYVGPYMKMINTNHYLERNNFTNHIKKEKRSKICKVRLFRLRLPYANIPLKSNI